MDVDELRVAAGDADLDAPALELGRELERRLGERLLEAAGERRLERDREKLRRAGGRLVADCRHAGEVVPDRLDVSVDLHDGSVTSQ